jgi:three-Cys-motif partner protein
VTINHRFGGDWTEAKLEVLRGYLAAYTKALKRQPFRKLYIDAFAGTGYRTRRPGRETRVEEDSLLPGFPDLDAAEPQALLEGSARIALQCEPRFDSYLFIEKRRDRCEELKSLAAQFPDKVHDVEIRQGEANQEIRALCAQDWRRKRAVLFLDPYGMAVEWVTIEAIARTRAIDLWLLFPLGIGVNRLLTRSGEIPLAWQRKLDSLLGTGSWRDALYRAEQTPSLFESPDDERVKATTHEIGRFFIDRLRSIFAGVASEPGILKNARNNPLYLLCFAAANERGAPIALRIAQHLLRGLR